MGKFIGLVVKNDAAVSEKADGFEVWLKKKGCRVVRKASGPPQCENGNATRSDGAPKGLFCVFVLGGDGTFLSAVRWLGDQQVPLLGFKFGEVGFLAEAAEDHLFTVAETILNEAFSTLSRMRLDIDVFCRDKVVAREVVLNDVVINKGALARLAHIKTYVNDGYLTDYRADGLIVSTPTGSTAYSLAAGGPIIHPAVPAILITPICPFTLTNRPLIVPDTSVIKLELAQSAADIMLTFDGQVGLPIDESYTIVIRKAKAPVTMITLPERGFFNVLRTKLRWGGSRM